MHTNRFLHRPRLATPARSKARYGMLLLGLFVAFIILVAFDLIAWRWGFDSRPSRDSRVLPDWKWPGAPEESGTTHDD